MKKLNQYLTEESPEYKLIEKGRNTLTVVDLISHFITHVEDPQKIARDILATCDNKLSKLSSKHIFEFTRIEGVTKSTAVKLAMISELMKRYPEEDLLKMTKVSCSRDVYSFMKFLEHEEREHFYVLLLNRGNRIIRRECTSSGGRSGTVADPKIIFETALLAKASSIILCHNHPSGNLKPSESDIRLTQKLKRAGVNLDLPVIDHIIVSSDGYYSFADEGIL